MFVSIMDRIESLKTDIQQTPEREAKINQFVTQLEVRQSVICRLQSIVPSPTFHRFGKLFF